MATWRADLRSGKLALTDDQLGLFGKLYVLDPELLGRMSRSFLFDLYVMDFEFGISPHEILESVKELETGETPTGVKPATQFTRAPLRGLWHKHFFAARFLAHNMILGLRKNGVRDIVESAMHPSKGNVVTREMIEEVAHRVTHEPLEARDAAGKLTGEWIVFARRGGKNYYCCIAGHEFGDEAIFEKVVTLAAKDFPDIADWISESAGTLQ